MELVMATLLGVSMTGEFCIGRVAVNSNKGEPPAESVTMAPVFCLRSQLFC